MQVFEYNGSPVAFTLDAGQIWVNATQMAKPFGKMSKDYLVRNESKALICAILSARGIPLPQNLIDFRNGPTLDLVRVINGDGGGTWLHRDLALDFARWLSPEFALWCDRKIQELLTTGKTEIPTLARDWMAMGEDDQAIAFFSERKCRIALEVKVKQDAPLVEYAKRIEATPLVCSVDECAKEIKAEVKKFREWVQGKYLFKRHGEWWPREEHGPNGSGLFEIKTAPWTAKNGTEMISHTVKVTGRGRIKLAHAYEKLQTHEVTA